MCICPLTIGELHFGFTAGSRYEANVQLLNEFVSGPNVMVLPVTVATAECYGRIIARLRDKGRPIPTNDVWIAAHAIEWNINLVTYDQHFAQIDDLKLVLLQK